MKKKEDADSRNSPPRYLIGMPFDKEKIPLGFPLTKAERKESKRRNEAIYNGPYTSVGHFIPVMGCCESAAVRMGA